MTSHDIYDRDDGDIGVIRSNQDKYEHATNFSGLPDLPTVDQDAGDKKCMFTKLDKLSEISRTM